GDQSETLTQKEADLLKLLGEHRNEVVKRSFILETIWGKDDYFLGRSLDVFISRLRKYLKDDPRIKIENIHGVGFKFKVEE
ncbi:MAG: winged helix-turn-helix domain-containing protein, partial [Saprospiraceae bacterium]